MTKDGVRKKEVALVGARGHVGAELVRLLAAHPHLELVWVGSRSHAGQPLDALVPGTSLDLVVADSTPEAVAALEVDAVVLALPNDLSADYLGGIAPEVVVVDMSADHRFDDTWIYGQPERFRERLRGARRIACPGCYATAAQLAIAPLAEELAAPPRIFGVSGYSGAGTTPSPKNDPEALRDNLMPYALVDHMHERELTRHLGHPVHFMPHVAPFFRGIVLTIDLELRTPRDRAATAALYAERYADEPLVRVQDEAPLPRDAAGRHHVTIGGFTTKGSRLVVVATIDNLLKGAATQALQNLGLALGFPELSGLDV
ncbi:MAG: N-acetyl-gamma-glutamyl-phosphate reductase [Myxococcales bacterium]|nr:N-acetyl-gamma-glutamyl-phosphate reductase [Myxococcales bacterium]